jgi:hypothetical protein
MVGAVEQTAPTFYVLNLVQIGNLRKVLTSCGMKKLFRSRK